MAFTQTTIGNIISRVKRRPLLNRVPDAYALDKANDVYYDICMEVPEVASLAFSNALDMGTLTAGVGSYALPDRVAQVYSVWWKNTSSGAITPINETTRAAISRENPDWVMQANADPPQQWFVQYMQAPTDTCAKLYLTVYPAPSVVANRKIYVLASQPYNAPDATSLGTSDNIPAVLEPGWAIEAGLAYRLALASNPSMAAKYLEEYIMSIQELQDRVSTFSDRMPNPTMQNARSN